MKLTQTQILTGRPAEPKRTKEQSEKQFVDRMLYVLKAPTLCWPGYEEDITPEMQEKALKARLFKEMSGTDLDLATDEEVCIYMSTATLANPPGHTWFKIYINCFYRTFKDHYISAFGDTPPEPLQPYEETELTRFKEWIFKKQMEHIKSNKKDRVIASEDGLKQSHLLVSD